MPEQQHTTDVGGTAGRLVLEGITAAVSARGRATVALSGGTAPIALFRWLAEHLSPELARATLVTWADERHVPQAGDDWTQWSPDSNRRLVWEHWLSKVAVRPRELPLDAPGTLDEALAVVSARFVAEVGRVDVVVLGAGPDGHTASLFPGHPALRETAPVLAVSDSPKPPPERLTLSLPVLEDCDLALLVAPGAEKKPMLARAAAGDASLPLGMLKPRGRWVWVVDPD
jgi:6-phosphogluconolactonase